jgi:hypothetical protein
LLIGYADTIFDGLPVKTLTIQPISTHAVRRTMLLITFAAGEIPDTTLAPPKGRLGGAHLSSIHGHKLWYYSQQK